jgi:transketolase
MTDIQKALRIQCLNLSHLCQDGNLQSAFSCMDIIWGLYNKHVKWEPDNKNRNIFVISKGQATLALYAVLIQKGILSEEVFQTIGQFNSPFSNQIDITKVRGFENAAGSLGHGLPIAVGMAIANQIQKIGSTVYVLVGDGEFMEGTMWEACMLAGSHKLRNLHIIIDDNCSITSMVDIGSMQEKLGSFGFYVQHVDGHNAKDMEKAFACKTEKPIATIAHTIRGFGSALLQSDPIWFHKAPDTAELQQLIKEIQLT